MVCSEVVGEVKTCRNLLRLFWGGFYPAASGEGPCVTNWCSNLPKLKLLETKCKNGDSQWSCGSTMVCSVALCFFKFLCHLRLAKSTLTLIPLLGTHEVIFAFITDEHARGMLRFVKLFTELSFASFQVTLTVCPWAWDIFNCCLGTCFLLHSLHSHHSLHFSV